MNKLSVIGLQEAGVSTHQLITVVIEIQGKIELHYCRYQKLINFEGNCCRYHHFCRMSILQNLCTQSLMISTTMKSQDAKAQSQKASLIFDNYIQTYNKFMTRFQEPSSFHDLVTNP